ncbi:MAG TPA: endonuclease/exonuclease/phosphatase family protein [Candidatus Binataceae bacterium]|nr:endonuclease/exonuclease/phosphatase family protein [Candidatus Binataceae bacterium]
MELRVEAVGPVEPAEHRFPPTVVNRPARALRSPLKVVAFNAQTGRHWRAIAQRLRRPPLAGADLVLISEADWRMHRSGGHEIAAELAAEMGMSFAYAREFGVNRPGREIASFLGNAILSSRPLTDVRVIRMPSLFLRRKIRRMVGAPTGLTAQINVNGRAIAVGMAHLNSRADPVGRETQMRRYLASFPSGLPAIFGGDLNTTTVVLNGRRAFQAAALKFLLQPRRLRQPQLWEPLFERLAEAGFSIDGANQPGKPTFTFSRAIPPFMRPKLDWIALRDLTPVPGSAAVVPARLSLASPRISDHDFIVCDVMI